MGITNSFTLEASYGGSNMGEITKAVNNAKLLRTIFNRQPVPFKILLPVWSIICLLKGYLNFKWKSNNSTVSGHNIGW